MGQCHTEKVVTGAPESHCPHSRMETCVQFNVPIPRWKPVCGSMWRLPAERALFCEEEGAGSGRILLSIPQTSKRKREGLGSLICVLHLFMAGLCHIPIMTSLRCQSSVKVPLLEESALDAMKVKPESNQKHRFGVVFFPFSRAIKTNYLWNNWMRVCGPMFAGAFSMKIILYFRSIPTEQLGDLAGNFKSQKCLNILK